MKLKKPLILLEYGDILIKNGKIKLTPPPPPKKRSVNSSVNKRLKLIGKLIP